MSQEVEIAVEMPSLADLLEVLREFVAGAVDEGLRCQKQAAFVAADGTRHAVDYVISDRDGARLGLQLDAANGRARFVGHDGRDRRASSLAGRITQRYAYSRVVADLERKGYRITRDERQADGSIQLTAQRWR
jgi:hypothetical protein